MPNTPYENKAMLPEKTSLEEGVSLEKPDIDESNVYEFYPPSEYVALTVEMGNSMPRSIRFVREKKDDDELGLSLKKENLDNNINFAMLSERWLEFSLGFFEMAPRAGHIIDYLHFSQIKNELVLFAQKKRCCGSKYCN